MKQTDDSVLDAVRQLKAERDEAVKALEPFAGFGHDGARQIVAGDYALAAEIVKKHREPQTQK